MHVTSLEKLGDSLDDWLTLLTPNIGSSLFKQSDSSLRPGSCELAREFEWWFS